ncbi:MAG: arginase family protein, partial [Cyclobacteriaceae bacterium]|nr:arginase family protein [Cyclobacteriaceae bacterium]
IRDICEDEVSYINNNRHRITTFYDESIKEAVFQGSTWQQQVERIIEELPELIYISFDIDGLAPAYCPNTGTPVPGGLTFEEATYLIRSVVKAGKTIIGFDLNEVAPGDSEWDENVGARLLYQLACWMGVSQGKIEATIS